MSEGINKLWERLEELRGLSSKSDLLWEILSNNGDIEITPDILRDISRKFGTRFIDSYLSPPELVAFIADIAAIRTPDAVLDPTCGSGLLLKEVSDRVKAEAVHGVDINEKVVKVAKRLLGKEASVFTGDILGSDLLLEDTYDLIVAEPPFGMRMSHIFNIDGKDIQVKGQFSDALVCWVCTRLSEKGMALLILPSPFAWSRSSNQVRKVIGDLDCAVTACVHIPGGSLQGTGIEAYIVVIEKDEQDIVFIGQYTPNKDHQDVLIENLRKRREGKRTAQGRLCEWEDFRGYTALESTERINELVARLGLSPVLMKNLVSGVVKTNKADFNRLDPIGNSVYLPCVGRGKAMTSQNELSKRLKDYVQLQIDPELADARFVAEMFNQELGQLVLDSIRTGSVIPRFSLNDLREIEFYIPPLEIQEKLLKSLDQITNIRSEIDELEGALWSNIRDVDSLASQVLTVNQEDRFVDWIETLPFPLASILWRYKSNPRSVRDQYEILLHFFEALAEFIATVHLSAFSSDSDLWVEYGSGMYNALGRQNLSLDRATFGSWKCVVEYLGSSCRKLLSKEPKVCYNLFSTNNLEVIKMFISPELLDVLQNANSIRNTWHGHTGAVGDRDAERIHTELFSLVQTCRGLFRRYWQDYELVQPSDCRFIEGIFRYKVRRVVGTRTPFEIVERESIEGLEDSSLYLLDPNSDRGLHLLPFVKMLPSPPSEVNACYFYNRRQGDESRYISYHFESDPDLTNRFSDTIEALDRLASVSLQKGN